MKQTVLLGLLLCLTSCAVEPKKPNDKSNASGELPPKLLKPEVRKIWVPPIIKNGGQEWEEGHYLYRIERDTTWSR